jgi:hypothetical protein
MPLGQEVNHPRGATTDNCREHRRPIATALTIPYTDPLAKIVCYFEIESGCRSREAASSAVELRRRVKSPTQWEH